jgi:hypothetical protein
MKTFFLATVLVALILAMFVNANVEAAAGKSG